MAHLGLSDLKGYTSSKVDALFDARGERDVGDGFRVVRVGESSPLLPEAIDVIARGECGTAATAPDPLLDWVVTGRERGVCEALDRSPSADREAWFRWMATYCASFGTARGGLYALVDKASGRVVAAAVTGPPHTTAFSSPCIIGIRKAGMSLAPVVLLNPRMQSLGLWQQQTEEGLAMGGENYLYVVIFATAPEVQGRGCGSALLRHLADVADADGVVSYLETAGARNVGFYAKKGGFREVARSPVAGFRHEGGAVAMRRPPSRKSSLQQSRGRSSGNKNTPSHHSNLVSTGNSSDCCHVFSPKRHSGPLANYCSVCGGHSSAH